MDPAPARAIPLDLVEHSGGGAVSRTLLCEKRSVPGAHELCRLMPLVLRKAVCASATTRRTIRRNNANILQR